MAHDVVAETVSFDQKRGNIVTLRFGDATEELTLALDESRLVSFERILATFIALVPQLGDRKRPELRSFKVEYAEFPRSDGKVRTTVSLRGLRSESFRPGEAGAHTELESFVYATVAALNGIAFPNS